MMDKQQSICQKYNMKKISFSRQIYLIKKTLTSVPAVIPFLWNRKLRAGEEMVDGKIWKTDSFKLPDDFQELKLEEDNEEE